MIELVNLEKTFWGHGGLLGSKPVKALRGISMTIRDGAAISLIGESGCGKTTLGRILAGYELHTSGDLRLNGVSTHSLTARDSKEAFLKVQLIQQDPYAALNPARTLGSALFDPLRKQAKKLGKGPGWIEQRAEYLLSLVGLDPSTTLSKFQHNLSGGQRQRFVIARALTVDPDVLIADEAVSMIDVSLRLEVLKLLRDLRSQLGIATIFITHDVAAARYIADDDGELYVLYKGEIVERGLTDEVIRHPVHPYTQALLSAIPVLRGIEVPGEERFSVVQGDNDPDDTGCLFASRCPFSLDRCRREHPTLHSSNGMGREHACWYPQQRKVAPVPYSPSGPMNGGDSWA